MMFAIEVEADRCRIEGNRIDLAAQGYGGVLVRGRHADVIGNRIVSAYGPPSLSGPIGVFAGAFTAADTGDGDSTNLALNHFTGVQLAVSVSRTRGMRIAGNMISGNGRTAGRGIAVTDGMETLIAENQLRDVALPLQLVGGTRNRVIDNVVAATSLGAFISGEGALEFCGNLIEDAALLGVGVQNIDGSNRFVNNRIAHCAYAANDLAVGIGVLEFAANVDVIIESCEIVNTGVSPDRSQSTPGLAIGIGAGALANVEVANNRVVYEGTNALDPNQEHRAVMLIGSLAYAADTAARRLEIAQGGALITGNVFQGPGRTHLVELLRVPIAPPFDLRFEKVTFANNRCDHSTMRGEGASTVALFGNHMIVTGNHVKASLPSIFAMHLGNRPRVALLANYTTGGYTAVNTTVPAPLANFNVRI
ncbi:MAG TPA: right-handed parallel beta-helix repeat-containing protein [Dongiaceae bacterium]